METYRHYDQGRGMGQPSHKSDGNLRAVGTTGCLTCLCVYVHFNNNSVFVAHMFAYDEKQLGKAPENEQSAWRSTPEKGRRPTNLILRKLESQPWANMRKQVCKAFAVCPAIEWYRNEEEMSNSSYILAALRLFFQGTTIELLKGHGFVAGPEVPMVLFGWVPGSAPIGDDEGDEEDIEEDGNESTEVEWDRADEGYGEMKDPKHYNWQPDR